MYRSLQLGSDLQVNKDHQPIGSGQGTAMDCSKETENTNRSVQSLPQLDTKAYQFNHRHAVVLIQLITYGCTGHYRCERKQKKKNDGDTYCWQCAS
jgi:hypothetical protein